MSDTNEPLAPEVIEAYLTRIGLSESPELTLDGLTTLQQSHLSTVPFENLDVASGIGVATDLDHSIDKVVSRNRGGWCFELNGAFAALLRSLGFPVVHLGAAVLLEGPTTVIDHLTLEVMVDQPYLVDVGFGDSFTTPLLLNSGDEQDGGSGTFQLIASPQGTTLARIDDGVPAAQYRFKRVAHTLSDFTAASNALQDDRTLHWSTKPFATRLIDGGPDRVTLLKDRLKFTGGAASEESVAPEDWADTLEQWFGMSPPS